MQIIGLDGHFGSLTLAPPVKKKGPKSKRALVIQDMADLVQMPFPTVMRKTFHIPGGEVGTKLLKSIYEEAMMEDDKDGGKWRRIKLWQLIKKTKV
jgi:hypothetical protein